MNVLRFLFFFFNSPRHSGSNVGNKYLILYTKSQQAGGGRESIVSENQCCLLCNLLKSTLRLKTVHLVLFHSENPWQSTWKGCSKKSVFFNGVMSFCFQTITSYFTFDTGLSFWSPRTSSALWSSISSFLK